jgi:hypothetical protein
MWMG